MAHTTRQSRFHKMKLILSYLCGTLKTLVARQPLCVVRLTGMEAILEHYRIPVAADPSGLKELQPEQIKVCDFFLRRGPESGEGFYECGSEGCLGAGLSTFDLSKGTIPDEIIEEMRFHANFCRALFPLTRAKL